MTANPRPERLLRKTVVPCVVVAAWAMAAGAFAQGPPEDRPQKRDCDKIAQSDNMSKAEMINDRIDCRTENLNAEMYILVDRACESEDIFTDTQKTSLENMRARAEKARKRTKEAGGFKALGRKQNSTCFLQEHDTSDPGDDDPNGPDDGNNDGVCSNRGGMKEKCAEVIGDGVGDDDGICQTMGGHKEVCVEICDSPLNDQDDDNFDEDAAADTEAALKDAEHTLAEANQEFEVALQALAHATQSLQTSSADNNDCKDVLAGVRKFAYVARQVAAFSAELGGSMGYDLCSAYGGQTIGGFNTKSVCMVFAAVKGVLNSVVLGIEIWEDNLTERAFDASLKCMEQQDTQLKSVQQTVDETEQQLGETDAKLKEIEGKVDALNARIDEVLELLKTPLGLRGGFPSKP